ncbi:MAG TPA: polysaccharide biosynthesis/export family protein [Thermoanaerobaculia bacterium]|jgi:polysaccharide export outer membrane protein
MKRLSLIVVAAFGLVAAAAAQDLVNGSDVRIGPRDVVDVKVVQDDKLNTTATVSDEGAVTMPIVGKIVIAGMTQRQAEQRIQQVLEARLLNKADVTVQITQFGNKPISVVGAVTRPGNVGGSKLTLIQAITEAGGLAPGYGKTLYVIRTGTNGLTDQIAVDIDDLMVRGNADLNVPLAPNDVINVPVEVPLTVYVMGEVTHPGKVELRRTQSPSLLQAIAAAGGPTDRAGKTARITRAESGKSKSIATNWKRIAEGNGKDVPLEDGDTIYIKESVF